MAKLNPNIKRNKSPKLSVNPDQLLNSIRSGDRFALGKAITLIESSHPDDIESAQQILHKLDSAKSGGLRIGISGAPGVGKSTLIEALGLKIIKQGKRPAILAVDPSSKKSGGSILADKTRMQELSKTKDAFIRPSASGSTLGGVTRKTRESILLAEAAGFNPVIIETVGVGQSETAVKDMTDLFILVISPGDGDEIQGIKKGIMELADIIVVNKMDGKLSIQAEITLNQYKSILNLIRPGTNLWETRIIGLSAIEKQGINELWDLIKVYDEYIVENGKKSALRKTQIEKWFEDSISKDLIRQILNHPRIEEQYNSLHKKVISGELSAFNATNKLFKLIASYFNA